MTKTLWIVSGGAEAVPGIRRAKEMGLRIVVSDGNGQAPGMALADDRVVASTYDIEGTVAAALKYQETHGSINGVICMAADVPITVASVAEALGLPGVPVETAKLSSDKIRMKNRFAEAGIPVPFYAPLDSSSDLTRLITNRSGFGVVKPVDSRGARGVQRIRAGDDLVAAFEAAKQQSPTGRVMFEEFLSGPQVSTESIIVNGDAVTPGFIDRNYDDLERFAPFMIENGGQQPTSLDDRNRSAVVELAERAGRALGVKSGIVKGDMVLTSQGPKVIEIATRLSGGWMSSDQIPLATGVDIVGAAIRIALGEDVPVKAIKPTHLRGVCIRYFFPPPGRVVAIRGREVFEGQPWVHRLGFFVKPGDWLDSVTDHTCRAGFVITTGQTCDEAVKRACAVVETIKIETHPT